MTAQQQFKSDYRIARLYARREWVSSWDGAAMVRQDPRQLLSEPIYHSDQSTVASRAAADRAHFLRSAKDNLPSKFETVFFAAIDRRDYYFHRCDEVFGAQTAADFYRSHREPK